MYDIYETPVFITVFDLLTEYHLLRHKFPKTEKYTLGEKIEENLLTVLISIVEAGHAKKQYKIAPIEHALTKTECVKILIRLAAAINLITEKQYLSFQERIHRIGQMLGGWRNKAS